MPDERRLVVTQNSSANGVIEFLDPWFDPGDDGDAQDIMEVMREQSAAEDAVLLGRQTFEDFRGFWPLQTDDTTGITAHLNQVHKYVYSTTLTEPRWENSFVVSGDLRELVAELRRSPDVPHNGGHLGVTGSIRLVHALLEADLVDELRLFVHPVLTSNGRNLVPDGLAMQSLRLTDSRTFRSGVTLQTYVRA